MIKTRRLKPSHEHDIPGTKRKDEWPPLFKCCSAEIWRESQNGCDKDRIEFSNIYYCSKCCEYSGLKITRQNFKKS